MISSHFPNDNVDGSAYLCHVSSNTHYYIYTV